MDSFFSSSSVTQEEFNIFHNMDRELYARLVFTLRRDPAQSSQVMALWLWLEQALYQPRDGFNLVSKSLLPLPDHLLDAFADESVVVLNCVESESFPFSSSSSSSSYSSTSTATIITTLPRAPGIPMFQRLIRSSASLELFHAIRLNVICGVAEMANRVCARAFKDIMKAATEKKAAEIIGMTEASRGGAAGGGGWINNNNNNDQMMMIRPPFVGALLPWPVQQSLHDHQRHEYYNVHGGAVAQPRGFSSLRFTCTNTYNDHVVVPVDHDHQQRPQSSIHDDDHDDLLNGILSGLELNDKDADHDHDLDEDHDDDDDRRELPDDRTIFLTFSRGYPISEKAVKAFFTRKIGAALIEGLYMQDVRSENEQSLFARLVLRSASAIEAVLGGRSKVKFYIDGKHVLARKFISKSNTSTTVIDNKSNPSSPSKDQA